MSSNELKAFVWISKTLQQGDRLTRRMIEEHFHVSPRTAYRYLWILRKSYHAPIAYNREENSYRCTGGWNFFEELQKKL
jgi:predicted DNA-binding transcriptional regulator YafY